jgi:tetratricopeptide (TPR) repeat protein
MRRVNVMRFAGAWKRALPALCAVIHCSLAAGQGIGPTSAPTLAGGNTLPLSAAEQRFQQGLRLAAANKTEAAIKLFSGLTVDYPLLPQPYVQLAALYGQQGKLERAIGLLQAAVDRQLDDGALQESLGDLYVELARQSYRCATNAANPSPGAADKYATLQKIGSRPVSKGSEHP